jgi:3-oxoacyl-[acyl-carrier protein] reductase
MSAPRSAVVTGSSRGIGRDVAVQLLERGYSVIGCARGASDLQHKEYQHFRLDVTDEVSVCNMFREIAAKCGRLDLLINNAAMTKSHVALLTPLAEFASVVEVNLIGAFIVAREAIRLMKRTRFGRIINMSSINVPLASIGGAAYNASKAGLENMATTLSRECADDDITINCIGLSIVAGSGMAKSLNLAALTAKQQALIKPGSIDITDIIHAIEFFAAPQARNITGQTVYFGGVR